MEIIERHELGTSMNRLSEYEKKYGYDSKTFYEYYRIGATYPAIFEMLLTINIDDMVDWAFEYEIYLETKEKE